MRKWRVTWSKYGQLYCAVVHGALHDVTNPQNYCWDGIPYKPDESDIIKVEVEAIPQVKFGGPTTY